MLSGIKRGKKRGWMEPQISILSPQYSAGQLDLVVRTLNATHTDIPVSDKGGKWHIETIEITEWREELRRLVDLWMTSGPNLLQLFKANPDIQENCTRGKTFLVPTREGTAALGWMPEIPLTSLRGQKRAAVSMFSTFLVNPLAMTLGGPCSRCGKYYVKRTSRQKVYCSIKCGSGQTALSVTQRRRLAEKSAKLVKAQRAIDRYEDSRRRIDLQTWICREADVTPKWITRALNEGRLHRIVTTGVWHTTPVTSFE